MENSLLFIFDEIWPETIIVQGLLPDFGATLKIHKKSNFDPHQFKLSMQHKYMYIYQKKIIKMENSLLVIFDEIWPKTMHYSTGFLARFWSNFKNSQKI